VGRLKNCIHGFGGGGAERKRPLGRPKRRWEDNIKMDLQDVRWEGMDWIDLDKDRTGVRIL
jgi:hypothetical protein